MSPEDWRQALERLRQQLTAAKLRTIAVCADAAATLERVQRDRIARRGGANAVTEEIENFVPESRSKHVH